MGGERADHGQETGQEDGPAAMARQVTVAAVLCGVALVVRRWRWPAAPLLVTVATAWWGWPLLPLLGIALFDLAVVLRARLAVGSALAALGADLLSYPDTQLWRAQTYASAVLVPPLAVLVGPWLGSRRRPIQALASDVGHLRVEAELREEAARAAERSRMSTEMHDVPAHRLSLIALHTGVLATRSAPPCPHRSSNASVCCAPRRADHGRRTRAGSHQ
ncbi:histidine kinase [Streptomyces sp. B21-108]|uniref:histidine kinase n=1 Tax=Streptomyces sp. B21-108 TaxID=3039419 RepID=UPI002FEFBF2B